MPSTNPAERGSALLAVLATVAVLTAVAFAMSGAALRSLDGASLRSDSAQAYFLARGGIEATLNNLAAEIRRGTAVSEQSQVLRFEFGSGTVEVALVPDGAKLNVNRAGPETLAALIESTGARPADSQELAAGIVAYRDRLRQGLPQAFWKSPNQSANLGPNSSFEQPAASIQMVEELLSVPGMHPDLIYGSYQPAPDRIQTKPLRRVAGLLHYLRTHGTAALNINAAPREVLAACGLSASTVDRVLEERKVRPIQSGDTLLSEAARQSLRVPLSLSSSGVGWMLTATARLNEERAIRRVTAFVKAGGNAGGLRIARWFELGL